MSILLEALRKSEKDQHSPEAPNIHTDDQSGPVSDSIKTGPLALLLVVALFASGWFVWQQYQPPAGSSQPPVTLKADQVRAVTVPTANTILFMKSLRLSERQSSLGSKQWRTWIFPSAKNHKAEKFFYSRTT